MAADKSNNMAEQSIDETLEKTDFGQIINQNKKSIIVIGALLVIGIFGFSFYTQNQSLKSDLALSNAHDFKINVLDKFNEKKLSADEFSKQMKEMPASIKGEVSILPAVLISVKELGAQGKNQEAKDILTSWQSNFNEGSFAYFFTTLNLSQVLEDLGDFQGAMKELTILKKSSIELLKSKILLDLARLQINSNQNQLAKDNLDIILKDYKDSQEAKEAQVYLAQLKK